MERARPRGRRYTDNDRKLAQAMLARGDRIEDVAAYFGANQGRFKKDSLFPDFDDLPYDLRNSLPPPGPYEINKQYVRLYQLITEVNELWNKNKLPKAKGLLEDIIRYGVHVDELRDPFSEALDEVMRDAKGRLQT